MKILSLNIFCRPKPIKSNKRDYRSQRLNILIDRVKNYDIVCLQEFYPSITNKKFTQRFISEMKKNKFIYQLFGPSTRCCQPISGGLATFSKIKFTNFGQEAFSNKGTQFDKFTSKGFQYMDFDSFLLINTHLQADYQTDPSKSDYAIQLDQLSQINKFTLSYEKVLILGDFNIDFFDTPYLVNNQEISEQKRVKFFFDQIEGQYQQDFHDDQPSLGFNSPSQQYKTMMQILNGYQDVLLDVYQLPPITFQDCDKSGDKVVIQEQFLGCQSVGFNCMRLDYAFSKDVACTGKVLSMRLEVGEHQFLTKLSDHNAMEIEQIEPIGENENVDVVLAVETE